MEVEFHGVRAIGQRGTKDVESAVVQISILFERPKELRVGFHRDVQGWVLQAAVGDAGYDADGSAQVYERQLRRKVSQQLTLGKLIFADGEGDLLIGGDGGVVEPNPDAVQGRAVPEQLDDAPVDPVIPVPVVSRADGDPAAHSRQKPGHGIRLTRPGSASAENGARR